MGNALVARAISLLADIDAGRVAVHRDTAQERSRNWRTFTTTTGWVIEVFVDGGEFDYIERLTLPNGRDSLEPYAEALCDCEDYTCGIHPLRNYDGGADVAKTWGWTAS